MNTTTKESSNCSRNHYHESAGRVEAELRLDLWPAMLKRIEVSLPTIPWFDWALLAAVAGCLILFPGAIPVLLYHP